MAFSLAYGDYDKDPEHYYLEDNGSLRRAIDIALRLGKPLLLTGEPGTGKTQLAYKAASILSQDTTSHPVAFIKEPFTFNTKTSSAGKELFYDYDAVSHFQDKDGKDKGQFIQLTAMGKAILQTWGRLGAIAEQPKLNRIKNVETIDKYQPLYDEPRSSVVLIDEIDKAPRDFPNDLLDEIENNRFAINELDIPSMEPDKKSGARILVILTSNIEKNLPDAFLRRCIFYHIPFPDDAQLLKILARRMKPFFESQKTTYTDADLEKYYKEALKLFNDARDSAANKQPATSELIDWIKVLHIYGLFTKKLDPATLSDSDKTLLRTSLHTLFKTRKDFEVFEEQKSLKQDPLTQSLQD